MVKFREMIENDNLMQVRLWVTNDQRHSIKFFIDKMPKVHKQHTEVHMNAHRYTVKINNNSTMLGPHNR